MKRDLNCLKSLNKFIYKIDAINKPKDAINANTQIPYLRQQLYLSEGAKVSLTININSDIGLYNHSEGTVVKILYKNNYQLQKSNQPYCVLVDFPNFRG